MNHEIRLYGDPVLRTAATPIAAVTDEVRRLAASMIDQMRVSEGVGLAAQQIGETRSICVIEVPEGYDQDDEGQPLNPGLAMPMVLINPVITAPSKKTTSHEEGCLSFPGIRGSISRPHKIHVTALNEKGEPLDFDVRGFTARVIQHEVDHLNGVLFIDRMSAAKRLMLKGRLARLAAGEIDGD